jgi:putative transposase
LKEAFSYPDPPPLNWSTLLLWILEEDVMSKRSCKMEKIVSKLRQVNVLRSQGSTISDAIRQIGVSEVTFYRWRKEYGGHCQNNLP